MLKTIGAVVVVGALIIGGLWFGGFLDADVDVDVSATPKTQGMVQDGLNSMQNGIDNNLDKVRNKVGGQHNRR